MKATHDYALYRNGDINRGMKPDAAKVLVALNRLSGSLTENLVSMQTGLEVRRVRRIIQRLESAGILPDQHVRDGKTFDADDFDDLLEDLG